MDDWQDKPFEELTDADLDAMDQHPWTSEQIATAIGLALKARDYLRMIENTHLTELEANLAAADTVAEKVAHIERAAERLGAMA